MNFDEITKDSQSADYQLLNVLYALADPLAGYAYADDNQKDGTPSFTHNFMSYQYYGDFGMTDVAIHEGGHHFGLSHPHDGYDYEDDVDYAAQMSQWTFTWVGDEANTVMNYFSLNNEFSQFDRDNLNRWHTAAYLSAVNRIVGKVLASGSSNSNDRLKEADNLSLAATTAFTEHRYLDAVKAAKSAYETALSAAAVAGVKISGNSNNRSVDAAGSYMHDYYPPNYANGDLIKDFSFWRTVRAGARSKRF